MPGRCLLGVETEYALGVDTRTPGARGGHALESLMQAARTRLPHLPDGASGMFLRDATLGSWLGAVEWTPGGGATGGAGWQARRARPAAKEAPLKGRGPLAESFDATLLADTAGLAAEQQE